MTNPKLKYLEDVPWDNSLKLSNGKTVHGLEQLPMVIKFSDDEVFTSHVNDTKNDFSVWVKDVIGDSELAARLLNVRTKDEFLKFMDQAITEIKNYKEPEPTPQPIVQPVIQQLSQQPVQQSFQQPMQQAVPQSISQPVIQSVFPQPVITQSAEKIVSTVSSKAPFISESSIVDASTTLPTSQTQPLIQTTIIPQVQPMTSEQSIQPSQPASSLQASPAPISYTISAPVPKLDVPSTVAPSVAPTNVEVLSAVVEETFDFEEIFKVLISELEQEVLAWDAQTS